MSWITIWMNVFNRYQTYYIKQGCPREYGEVITGTTIHTSVFSESPPCWMSLKLSYTVQILSLACLQLEAYLDMGRGVYDTTGVKKPGAPLPPPK